jgi:DNA-binding CsgD family transcriptional regulator
LGCFDPLRAGRDAYERREWRGAYDTLRAADETSPLQADDLERLANATYLVGRDEEFRRLLERLHRLYVEAADSERAARVAFWLAFGFLLRGEQGQATAWSTRAQRLVEGRDSVEHGYLLLLDATRQLYGGQLEAARSTAVEAAAMGERFSDSDLVASARHLQGRALLALGQIAPGLKLLDEAMLAVVAGELSPKMTGLLYCSVIEACREVYELRRAGEWTAALTRWCEQQSSMVAFTGICLVHRSEILQFHGAWPDALTEARSACERSVRADRKPPGAALYQQAEIHRLRGEHAKAAAAYREASRLGFEPQPGLALLRLAQGRADAAQAAIHRILVATSDRLRRVRVLPAYAEILLAAGKAEEARAAARELAVVAESFDSDILRAAAAHAEGAVALREGDARAALGPLRRAFELWSRLEAPYEAARVRVLIAEAARSLRDAEAAALELEAARSCFAELGARADLERLQPTRRAAASIPRPLTARELEVLRLIAAGRTNKAIAAELRLSERTVDRHVSHILVKLQVPSRTAATAHAYSHGLL